MTRFMQTIRYEVRHGSATWLVARWRTVMLGAALFALLALPAFVAGDDVVHAAADAQAKQPDSGSLATIAADCKPGMIKQVYPSLGDNSYIPLFGARQEDQKSITVVCSILQRIATKGKAEAVPAPEVGEHNFRNQMDIQFTDGSYMTIYEIWDGKLAVDQGKQRLVLNDAKSYAEYMGLEVLPEHSAAVGNSVHFNEPLHVRGNNVAFESFEIQIFWTTTLNNRSSVLSAKGVHFPSKSSLLLYSGAHKFGRYDVSFTMPAYGEAFDGTLQRLLPGDGVISIEASVGSGSITGGSTSAIKLHPASKGFLSVNGVPAADPSFMPLFVGGHALVPVRAIAALSNENVVWDAVTKSVLIRTKQSTVSASSDGSPQLWIDEEKAAAELQPIIHNGRAYVPIRAVTAAFGMPVVWDGGTRSVNVTVASPQSSSS
ncbi:copper amine oxidase N-terminal domain-containing protein [Paenibacillus sp. CF384]|uniref:copper amine oxidase N-terminal domain-containing protein n=1 Tax=Paenibacillus sp. CF384 TaxID=1884382 RepID=UPI0008998ABC|nr:copper amine oxidase N-terminal domain-containing protein [Paenibacillus sp. CF384]SDX20849.1 Copper amine oxidase N-terminal domain-containing protein [Paenibacillus sp. CF384]